MNHPAPAESQTFHASKDCPLIKMRRNTALVGVVVALFAVVAVIRQPVLIGFVLGGVALVFGLIDFFMRRQLRWGAPIVTLTDEHIVSPNFSGKMQLLLWKDVAATQLISVQGQSFIEFQLRASPAASLWSKLTTVQPRLPLSTFSREDQEALFDEVLRRHRRSCTPEQIERLEGPLNELRENREFEARLTAMQPHTWITWGLIAVNLLIWGATLADGGGFLRSPADKLLVWGGNAASEVQKGEWWRLLSATFLHSGFLHVGMNMIGLYCAGVWVERIYGKRLYLLIYLAAGLVGSVFSLHFSAQSVVSVGASGAVFGVTGAFIVAVLQNRDTLPRLFSQQTLSGMGLFVLYSLVQGFGRQGIDNAAHIGGLLGGCLAAFVLPERFNVERFSRTFVQRAAMTVGLVGALVAGGVALAPRAPLDLGAILASQEAVKQGMRKFEKGLHQLQQEWNDYQAGKFSEREADERSRTVLAPVFREIAADLSQVTLHPDDPRLPWVRDARRMSELFAEQLAMASVYNEATMKFEPADAARSATIDAELKQIIERLTRYKKEAEARTPPR